VKIASAADHRKEMKMIDHKKLRVGRRPVVLALVLALCAVPVPRLAAQSGVDPAVTKSLVEAKSVLQSAIDTWNSALMAEARDRFLGCFLRDGKDNPDLAYYVALADYSLATFHLAAGSAAESDPRIAEGESYLDKALKALPEFADALALNGYLLGLEIANHPDRAMTLGMQSFAFFDRAMAADAKNPRVHLLRGIYQIYLPEAFGGGPDSSLQYLDKAIALFEKESIADPLRPSWGRDEALVNAALAHKQKGETAKAVELLKQALAVNPKSGRAKAELAALEK
jgi:tetratricopeptide (TPR) repeat protein